MTVSPNPLTRRYPPRVDNARRFCVGFRYTIALEREGVREAQLWTCQCGATGEGNPRPHWRGADLT